MGTQVRHVLPRGGGGSPAGGGDQVLVTQPPTEGEPATTGLLEAVDSRAQTLMTSESADDAGGRYAWTQATGLGAKVGAECWDNDVDHNVGMEARADYAQVGVSAGQSSVTMHYDPIYGAALRVLGEAGQPAQPLELKVGDDTIFDVTPLGQVRMQVPGAALVLTSPDGTSYAVTVANGGTLTVTAI